MTLAPNDERFTVAMERIADALEQLVLKGIPDDPYPTHLEPVDEIADLPAVRPVVQPVSAAHAAAAGVCPVHNVAWKVVPAGVSKKTGNAYEAFRACPTAGCTQRPPR